MDEVVLDDVMDSNTDTLITLRCQHEHWGLNTGQDVLLKCVGHFDEEDF